MVAGLQTAKVFDTSKMVAALQTANLFDSSKMFRDLDLDLDLDPATLLEQLQVEAERRIAAEPELSPEIACAIAAWFVCAVVFMLLIWFHLEEANRTGANLLQDNRAQLLHDLADAVTWAYATKKLVDRFLKRYLD
jgi:hypothetical protein